MSLPLVLLALALTLPAAPAVAASPVPARTALEPQRIRVPLERAERIGELIEAGLDVVEIRSEREADVLLWPGDEPILARLGVAHTVVDPAPGKTLAARAARDLAGRPRPAMKRVRVSGADGRAETLAYPPLGSGSLGGHWSYDEVIAKLEDLVASDAAGVVGDAFDTLGVSRQGRPLLGIVLGEAWPGPGPDPRPWTFLASLIHAREPLGMESLLYFVDRLLADYAIGDPFAVYLLRNRRILAVPVLNPDGYHINDSLYVDSGGTSFGLWRKNARDNNSNGMLDGNDGVDLNRNFSYQWGIANGGSSGTPSAETYRGPSAFSEPETQAQRDRIDALEPKTAVSTHTYSDLLLHPWGYTATAAPDSARFYEWNDEMSSGNAYQAGQAPRVLYAVNGEFSDWCYGETTLKPRLFSWSPEIGSPDDDFWPPASRILPLAEENLRTYTIACAIAGPWVRAERATLDEGVLNAGALAHLRVRARNRGLAATPAGLTASLAPLDAGATVVVNDVPYPALAALTSGDASGGASFTIAAFDSVTPGRLLRFLVEWTTPDGFYSRDTVAVLAGTPTVLAAEDFSGTLASWLVAAPWAIQSGDATHPSPYANDSPPLGRKYNALVNTRLLLRSRLDLSAGPHAWALFQAKWAIETHFDGTVFEVSTDSLTWTPLPGAGTTPGLYAPQIPGSPVWQGNRNAWSEERVDLSGYAGPGAPPVWIRFRSFADAGTQFDGFVFDSLRVVVFDPANQPIVSAGEPPPAVAVTLAPPVPQPARVSASLAFTLPRAAAIDLSIHDLGGRRVRRLAGGAWSAGRHALAWDLRDDSGRPVSAGVYFVRLAAPEGAATARVFVLR